MNAWKSISPHTVEKLSQTGPTAATPLPPPSVILAFQWPFVGSAEASGQTAALHHHAFCRVRQPAESFLAHVPVS